jgi:hypothetical protein
LIGLALTLINNPVVNIPPPSSPGASTEQWAEFRPADVNYSIEMPAGWTTTITDLNTGFGKLKMHIASVKLASRDYTTIYIAYPPEIVAGKPVAAALDGARDGAIRNLPLGTKLRKEERILISNRPAREIILDVPDNLVMIARFFMLDNFMIQAILIGDPTVEGNSNTKRFFSSLKVR